MNEVLMRAVVQTAAFLELSSDDVLDPDTAVKQLEGMAYLLAQLTDAEREQFVTFVRAEAEAAETPAKRNFLQAFPEAMLGAKS